MKLEEVIHMYIGCEVIVDGSSKDEDLVKLVGVVYDEAQLLNIYQRNENLHNSRYD